jgi:hypothetical protein
MERKEDYEIVDLAHEKMRELQAIIVGNDVKKLSFQQFEAKYGEEHDKVFPKWCRKTTYNDFLEDFPNYPIDCIDEKYVQKYEKLISLLYIKLEECKRIIML